MKYGGWESAASSPRQPDGWSPRGEEQQQEKAEEEKGVEEDSGREEGELNTEKQHTKKARVGGKKGRMQPSEQGW